MIKIVVVIITTFIILIMIFNYLELAKMAFVSRTSIIAKPYLIKGTGRLSTK